MNEQVDALMDQYVEAMERGDTDAARSALDAALAIDESFVPALGSRGIMYGEAEEYQLALGCFDKLAKLEPERAIVHYQRGLYLQELGRTDEALEAYGTAIDLDPDDPDALINRGRLFDDEGEPEAAIADYDRALAIDDKEEIAWCNRGNSLCGLERFEEALESYDRALALEPDSITAMLGRSTALMSMGRLEEANAARPVGSRLDRGEVMELRRKLASGDDLVARWYPSKHSNPEWLEQMAEVILKVAAECESEPPGLDDGVTISYGWSLLSVRKRGTDRILCEPDFTGHPLTQITYDISFTLQALVMMDMTHSIVDVEPEQTHCMDAIAIQHGTLMRQELVLHRIRPTEDRMSGWVVGPPDADAVHKMLEDEDYDMVPCALIVQHRPHLIKVLTLPAGFVVTFDGHAVTSVRDLEGKERFATDG